MIQYENHVQKIKNEVLQKIVKYAYNDQLDRLAITIADELSNERKSHFTCCVHKETAITQERVKLGLGIGRNEINVIKSACDKCQENRFFINNSCRGCLAHKCVQACTKGAISMIRGKAVIDDDKCIECGKCYNRCPYDAVSDVRRPCVKVCSVDAIKVDENKKALIDHDECIECGACVFYCPFGAIEDNSQILNVINELKKEKNSMYAIIAPSIAAQFEIKEIGKLSHSLKQLGFKDIIEVALGADMIIKNEVNEFLNLVENDENSGVLTSSCCPAFVSYINKKYPELTKHISSSISPMVATAKLVKSIDKDAKVVFIGPCIAKKGEAKKDFSRNYVDFVLTFEEIQAMLQGKEVDITSALDAPLDNASFYGRGFAEVGGLTSAIKWAIAELKVDNDYEFITCNGLKECDKVLKLIKGGRIKNAFIEGMACTGGCIKGPVALHHGAKDRAILKNYCSLAKEKTPTDAVRIFDLDSIDLEV